MQRTETSGLRRSKHPAANGGIVRRGWTGETPSAPHAGEKKRGRSETRHWATSRGSGGVEASRRKKRPRPSGDGNAEESGDDDGGVRTNSSSGAGRRAAPPRRRAPHAGGAPQGSGAPQSHRHAERKTKSPNCGAGAPTSRSRRSTGRPRRCGVPLHWRPTPLANAAPAPQRPNGCGGRMRRQTGAGGAPQTGPKSHGVQADEPPRHRWGRGRGRGRPRARKRRKARRGDDGTVAIAMRRLENPRKVESRVSPA